MNFLEEYTKNAANTIVKIAQLHNLPMTKELRSALIEAYRQGAIDALKEITTEGDEVI